jgi:hypothetical protein
MLERTGTSAISQDNSRMGDIVTASGVFHTGMTLGVGYSFSALVEDATLQQ